MKIVISNMPPYLFDIDEPIMHAEEVTDAGGKCAWRFWCDHCQAHHYHGIGFGHREAHCEVLGSPYHRGGYNLAAG